MDFGAEFRGTETNTGVSAAETPVLVSVPLIYLILMACAPKLTKICSVIPRLHDTTGCIV